MYSNHYDTTYSNSLYEAWDSVSSLWTVPELVCWLTRNSHRGIFNCDSLPLLLHVHAPRYHNSIPNTYDYPREPLKDHDLDIITARDLSYLDSFLRASSYSAFPSAQSELAGPWTFLYSERMLALKRLDEKSHRSIS